MVLSALSAQSIETFRARCQKGIYNPLGNHFCAFALKGKLAGMLQPPPPAYGADKARGKWKPLFASSSRHQKPRLPQGPDYCRLLPGVAKHASQCHAHPRCMSCRGLPVAAGICRVAMPNPCRALPPFSGPGCQTPGDSLPMVAGRCLVWTRLAASPASRTNGLGILVGGKKELLTLRNGWAFMVLSI
jgi:hypothetical protein